MKRLCRNITDNIKVKKINGFSSSSSINRSGEKISKVTILKTLNVRQDDI